MAREFPIHNGRMTTDLDANGHRIKNLPPGSGFTQVQSDWGQTDTTAPDFIKNKPTIPEPITVDPALSQTSENPVQNKVVAKALYTGFTEWQAVKLPEGFTFVSATYDGSINEWRVSFLDQDGVGDNLLIDGTPTDTSITDSIISPNDLEIRRTLITPTKTSQLTNDGPSSGPNVGHPFATTNQIPAPVDISGKLDGEAAYEAWESGIPYPAGAIVSHNGRLWFCLEPNTPNEPSVESSDWEMRTIYSLKQDALSSAQLAAANSGATAAKVATWDGYAAQIAAKADASDLPYRLVTPGEWEFSGVPSGVTVVNFEPDGSGNWYLSLSDGDYGIVEAGENILSVEIVTNNGVAITATRPSLPGHLLDRANNLIDATTGNVTLTLPPFVAGKVRDLLVACTIGLDGNDEPWSVIFQGGDGESISFKAEGDDAASATFPVPDAAGDWWYSLTERAPHFFAVSLKQLQDVTQPTQTQGGS